MNNMKRSTPSTKQGNENLMAKAPLFSAKLMPSEAKDLMYKEIEAWDLVNKELTILADREKEMRIGLFNKYFAPSPGVEEGTNHIALDYGKLLTADYRINRRVDEAQLDAAMTMQLIDRATVDQLFNYKPALKIGEWKDAPAEVRGKFADIITETPGTPGLKISSPKR